MKEKYEQLEKESLQRLSKLERIKSEEVYENITVREHREKELRK